MVASPLDDDVQPPFGGPQIGEVRHPFLVGAILASKQKYDGINGLHTWKGE